MSKKLIIAEKPSVANDIARAVGGFSKQKDYFESEQYVLASAVGHLLEIACPEDYEVKRGKWSFARLPVIPPHFDLRPIEKSSARLRLLVKLIKRKDVAGLVNACDAGREGELIFRYIVQHSKSDKPIERLWLQSMTPASIREQITLLRAGDAMQGLANAAICRSEADWLVGINGTRAMTAFNSKTGGFHLTTVGRVQTPTLAIVVNRENEIRAFKAKDYWELEATFECGAGTYVGKWYDADFKAQKKDKSGKDAHARAERIWDEARAQSIADACANQSGAASDESKQESRLAPMLFDLTSLQREANTRFGFSARATLSIAQALYEKHKLITYPRTDSRHLPEDYLGTVKSILTMLAGEGGGKEQAFIANYAPLANQVLSRRWVLLNKRIFNNAKISDHFAVIPTAQAPKSLNEVEQKLYDFIVRRFIAIFYPPAEYLVTQRVTTVNGHRFKTEGKILKQPGWLTVYGKQALANDNILPPLTDGEAPQTIDVDVKKLSTKPPARYSEATLLTAMEGAGKTIEDDELRSAMSGRGLGTPATRAQIIENLIGEQYLLREGRELIPTAKAFSLQTLLSGLDINELTSPELTGEWEWKLGRIERGEFSRSDFMQEIAGMTRLIVERAKQYDNDTIPGDFGTLSSPCPKCGGEIHENYKKFQCRSCDYGFWKIIANRQFEPAEIDCLLTEGSIGPLTGFRNKMGRPFSALLRLNADKLPGFDFGNDEEGDNTPTDFSQMERLGACPKCQSGVYDVGGAYICEKNLGKDKQCDFRISKLILQQPIESVQLKKMLNDGQSDLLTGFISNKTRRKFSARLKLESVGKISFVFEPRKQTTSKAKSTPPERTGA